MKCFNANIVFRCTDLQFQIIRDRAEALNTNVSNYVRAKVFDEKSLKAFKNNSQIVELAKMSGNLGKIGGLLKLWVMDYNRSTYAKELDIPFLVEELKKSQNEINALIKELKK